MLVIKPFSPDRAVAYAKKWAFSRNPLFYDYTGLGGNCTNFVSQAVYAGSCQMNFTSIFGWYYLDDSARTASWTGVDFFYNFLTANEGEGPFGREIPLAEAGPGDIVQLQRDAIGYYHTLLVVGNQEGDLLVSAQSNDAYDRPLSTYEYDSARALRVDGVRVEMEIAEDCYDALYNGIGLYFEGKILPAD